MDKQKNDTRTTLATRRLGLAVAAVMVFAATPVLAQTQYVYAEVIDSRPIYQAVTVASPAEECWQEEVRVRDSRHQGSNTPVILSTIIGGAIGNAVGNNKSSQRVGTVVGAVLGHSVGRDIVRANSHPQPARYQTVQHCEAVTRYRDEERLIGWQVRYRYNGEEFSVRTDQDPGDRIRLRVSHDPVL